MRLPLRVLLPAVLLLLALPSALAQSISIQSPQAGATYTADSTVTASWSSAGVNHYQLWYTRESGLACASASGWLLVQEHPYFPTTYDWKVPRVDSNAVRFRVEGHDAGHATIANACTGEFTIRIPESLRPPSPPTSLAATALTAHRVSVSWAASANALGYALFRNSQLIANISATAFTDPTSPATAYSYQVLAWNNNGNSTLSATAAVTTPAAGAGPPLLSYGPAANVSSSLGQLLTFSANFGQEANLTWLLDNATTRTELNVRAGSLALNATAVGVGRHVLRLVAQADNETTNVTWGWTIVAIGLCRVDAYGLDVQETAVKAAIRNTGELTTVVNATLTAGTAVLLQQNLTLAPGDLANLSSTYAFQKGITPVRISAAALCGAADAETLSHYVLESYACLNPAGAEGANRCDYAAREYLRCDGGSWTLVARNESQYCTSCGPQVCGDGACNCGESAATCGRDCRSPLGYTGNARCFAEDLVQREYRYPNGTVSWLDAEGCSYGCRNGACRAAPAQPTVTGACSLTLAQFDYQSPVAAGQQASATIGARNDGPAAGNVTLLLQVNNAVRGSWSERVSAGATLARAFSYPAPASSHTLTAQASGCGVTLTRSASVPVTSAGQGPTAPAQPLPLPFLPSPQPVIERTEVSFFPDSLEVPAFKSKVIAVRIQSKVPQLFTISASGVPEGWLGYERELRVAREDTLYVFVTPAEPGNHTIDLSVTAVSEQLRFPAQARLYVAPALPTATGIGWLDNAGAQVSRALAQLQSSPTLAIAALVLVFILIIALGAALLRVEFW